MICPGITPDSRREKATDVKNISSNAFSLEKIADIPYKFGIPNFLWITIFNLEIKMKIMFRLTIAILTVCLTAGLSISVSADQGIPLMTRNGITLSGAIELEAGFENSDTENGDTSDVNLATAELGIEARPMDRLTGFILFSWEDDDDKVIVDEAWITLGGSDSIPFYLAAGKRYVPFGTYATLMISDPITLDLGEIADTSIETGIEKSGFRGAVYAFNGEIDEADANNSIQCFGISAGYSMELRNLQLTFGADWINSILESETLSDAVETGGDLKDYAAGLALHALVELGPFQVMGEYVDVIDDINFTDGTSLPSPSAWSLEAGYTRAVFGHDTTVAAGFQESRHAGGLLPEKIYLGSVSVDLSHGLSTAIEYKISRDYSLADGGEDADAETLTLQLAFEF